jgi:hypothetical protein
MPKKADADLQKHTLNLYAGDMEALRVLFPRAEPTVIIRDVIHDLIVRGRANDPSVENLKVEIKV